MKRKNLLIAVMLMILIFAFASCEALQNLKNDEPEDVYVTYIYGESGGCTYNIKPGQKIEKPEDPYRENMIFDGWYLDDDTKWNFEEDVVTDSITLNAKWQPILYVVKFTDGIGGETVEQIVQQNDKVTRPDNPTSEGLTFEGWYHGIDLWNFDTNKITEDIRLIGKWSTEVVYELDGGVNSSMNPDTIYSTSSFPKKLYDPTKEGFIFGGWYSDAELKTPITEIDAFAPTTVYARWLDNVVEYVIKVNTVGGMPLSGLTVTVHEGDGYNAYELPKTTGTDGTVKFYLPEVGDFSVEVSGTPVGYDVKSGESKEDRYTISSGETIITLTSAPVTSGSHYGMYSVGDVMYDFTITDVYGNEYTLTELLKEKDMVMLNFWYCGCYFCVQEFPHINSAYDAYKDSIEILAINDMDHESIEDVKAFDESYGLSFPVFKVENGSEVSFAKFPSRGYPTTVIIDRYGVIAMIQVGGVPYEYIWTNLFEHFTGEEYEQRLIKDIGEFNY